MDVYTFEATQTGERFKVGCVCVDKMIREAGTPTNSLAAAREHARKERNRRARERAAVRRQADKDQARALLAANREAAEALPHPSKWRAEQGDTLADWAQWMLQNGGGPAAKDVIAALEAL
jgi:regulator of protease activity HflC (stomatin/prohibitin superfamily)